jgi:4-nitrophenyl phosphatase
MRKDRKIMSLQLPANIKAMILDMDGVLWAGDHPLLDMPRFFDAVRALNFPVIFATNNGTRSVDMYVKRLAGYGVTVEPWQVVNSSIAMADYLAEQFPERGPVFVAGEAGVVEALVERGFTVTGEYDEDALAVVAGMDRATNYEKLSKAALLIRAGKPFIFTNPDQTFPTPRGLVPGAGAFLSFLQTATGVCPTIIGKPEPYLYQFAIHRLGTLPEDTLAVGDRLDTDILGGQRTGCPTVLVMSGVTSPAELARWQPQPDFVLPNLADLLPLLQELKGVTLR